MRSLPQPSSDSSLKCCGGHAQTFGGHRRRREIDHLFGINRSKAASAARHRDKQPLPGQLDVKCLHCAHERTIIKIKTYDEVFLSSRQAGEYHRLFGGITAKKPGLCS
jgi:hypothetical protein